MNPTRVEAASESCKSHAVQRRGGLVENSSCRRRGRHCPMRARARPVRVRRASDGSRSGGLDGFLDHECRELPRISANCSVRRHRSALHEPRFFFGTTARSATRGLLSGSPQEIPARGAGIEIATRSDSCSFARIRGIRDQESRPSLPIDYPRTRVEARTSLGINEAAALPMRTTAPPRRRRSVRAHARSCRLRGARWHPSPSCGVVARGRTR